MAEDYVNWKQEAMIALREEISTAIDCKHLLATYQSQGFISAKDKQDIAAYRTRYERNALFLDLVIDRTFQGKTMTSYDCLVSYIDKKQAYPKLLQSLTYKFEEVKSAYIVARPPSSVGSSSSLTGGSPFRPGQRGSTNSSFLSTSASQVSTAPRTPSGSSVFSDSSNASSPCDGAGDAAFMPGGSSSGGPRPVHRQQQPQQQQEQQQQKEGGGPGPLHSSTPLGGAHPVQRSNSGESTLASPIAKPLQPAAARPSGQFTAEKMRPSSTPTRRATSNTSTSNTSIASAATASETDSTTSTGSHAPSTASDGSLIAKETMAHDMSPQTQPRANPSSLDVPPADPNVGPVRCDEP